MKRCPLLIGQKSISLDDYFQIYNYLNINNFGIKKYLFEDALWRMSKSTKEFFKEKQEVEFAISDVEKIFEAPFIENFLTLKENVLIYKPVYR